METQKNRRPRVSSRIRSFLLKSEMPQTPPSGYRIELFGRKRVSRALVSGVRRILVCNGEQVVLETKEERLFFGGLGLECLCYEGGVAEIYGDIRGFSFDEEGV